MLRKGFRLSSQAFDSIVVGGGHNGLVAAHYLAAAGLRVAVLERRHVVGGPCSPLECFPGYWGSFTNSPGSLEPLVVRDMRLENFGLEFLRPDPSVIHPFPDGRAFVGWRDRQRADASLHQFARYDVEGFRQLFDYLLDVAKMLGVSLFREPPTWRDLAGQLQTAQDEEMFGKVMFGSVKDLVDEYLESEEVKAVVATLGIMSTMAGPRTPGTPLMLLMRPLSLLSSTLSATHDPRKQPLRGSTGLPKGGMGAITQAMSASLEEKGVSVRTLAPVSSILLKSGAVAGVVLESGEELTAPLVLSNLNPRTTLLDLLPASALDPEFRGRVEKLKVTGSQFKLALALDGMPRFATAPPGEFERYAACQFRIAPSVDYLERAFDDAKYGRWSEGPVFWGLTPSVTDPSLVPEGKHLMSLNIYHAPYDLAAGNWETEQDLFGLRCIDVLEEYVPNIKQILVNYRTWSPKDLENEFGMIGGNITQGDMVPGREFSLRPFAGYSNYRTPIRGLYMCGSGVFPGGYVSGIPGHNAAKKAIDDLRRARGPSGGDGQELPNASTPADTAIAR